MIAERALESDLTPARIGVAGTIWARRGARSLLVRSPVLLARVSGPSMVPTLRDGDVVLARAGAGRGAVGRVVLARFRAMPERLVVKRAERADADGWWLTSDNPFAGGDSTVHGPADVHACVVLRIGRGRPWIGRVR